MKLPNLLSRSDSGDDEELKEQHAEDLEPRGESRQGVGSFVVSRTRRHETDPRTRYLRSEIETDVEDAPTVLGEYHREFYVEFALGQAALTLFDLSVSEPGWSVRAEIDGDKDEDMTQALETWGRNCAIHAGESGQDIMTIVSKCPSHRRSKGTLFVEKVRSSESELAAVMMLDPSTMSIYKRDDQNLVVQPNDPVDGDHPTTPNGDAAAYVQYDGHATKDEIPFAADDIIKLAYNVPEGQAWGTMIWRAIRENIRRFQKIKRDRGASIRLTGWPHLIYGLEGATQEQAQKLADAHDEGDLQANEGPKDDDESSSSRVGRTDYVNHQVNVEEVSPDVPDVNDAIMDEIEEIFSVMPVSKPMVAYAQDINQWVIEPLDRRDDLLVDDERRYLEDKWEPLFREKADELAGGTYEGEVRWRIEQPQDENPLKREDFDPERLLNLVRAHNEWPDAKFPMELFYHYAGMDREKWEETVDDAAVERAQEIVAQAQAEDEESNDENGGEDDLEDDNGE
ncbi:hypothetical protein HTZ84_05140 [Haloterrigena sp. SYSU A558-1]|uniref:Phage portal protein n=1 Tax=Haloterrigena gelatinilytica TaxID=2741724 RepID=A0ABX2L8K5_9EURY|nr:hypothetical protein [Haloterrigena gelatinilytica]NUC71698.1 hypothetical protein [Haloterrigena gelatinilytica]